MQFRHSVALAVLLTSMAVGAALPAAHAAGMKTFTDRADGFSIQYPSTWSVQTHVSNAAAKFTAPDTNAIVTASATAGTAGSAVIKAQQSSVLKGMGKAMGPVTYKLAVIHGVTYELSEIVTKVKTGRVLDTVLLDTAHKGYIYDFEAFLLFNAPSTKGETTTVQQILNSIILTK